MKALNTTIAEEVHRATKIEAARSGQSISVIVERALKRELARIEDLRAAGLSR